MRWIRDLLGLGLLLYLGMSGCAPTEPELRPPKQPEEFNPPPEHDPRYDKPIEYPKETLDQDPLSKKKKNGKDTPGPTGSPRNTMSRPGGSGF